MMVCCEGMAVMVSDNSGHQARPRLVLGYTDSAHASRCVRHFRRLGWEAHMVASGAEAQRLATELLPNVIVLDVDLPDESGWQTAAKILLGQRAPRVLLLASEADEGLDERARSLGAAALVRRDLEPETLASLVFDRQFSVAV
jgi:CheY-like chemotaxis protein